MNNELLNEFRETMQKATDQELVNYFNKEVGNTGWGNARSYYLAALREEITKRDMDSSIIIHEGGLSLKRNVKLSNGKLEFDDSDKHDGEV
jgi:hypothetical protein